MKVSDKDSESLSVTLYISALHDVGAGGEEAMLYALLYGYASKAMLMIRS